MTDRTEQLVQELRASSSGPNPVTTCDLTDALTKLGCPFGGYLPNLTPRRNPFLLNPDKVLIAPVYTVQFSGADSGLQPITGHFADTLPANHIIYVSGPTGPQGLWGGLMTLRARALNCSGIIIDGNIRDILEQRASDLPIWSKGLSALSPRGHAVCTGIGEGAECRVEETGGMVKTGDWIVADGNGVVCVPNEMLVAAIELAMQLAKSDALAAEDIRNGASVADTFARR